jgi:hypothetical protein
MTMPGYARLRRLMMPDEMMGPDMQAQFAPMQMQMPPMQQNGTGQAVGQLAGMGLSRLAKLRAPDLKPDGSSPFDKLPTAKLDGGGGGGFRKLFHFRQGGKLTDALKRPGDVAEVGEEGPELVRRLRGGELEVEPATRPRLAHPPTESQPVDLTLPGYQPFSRLSAADFPTTAPQPEAQPELPAADTSFRFSQFAPLDGGKTRAPGYAGQGVQSEAGEAVTRPKVVDELGYEETHPRMAHHSRIVEALKGAGLGFLRGAASNPENPLAAGIGGAASLGGVSAFKPELAEQAEQNMFTIPRLQQQRAEKSARFNERLKQAGMVADVALKTAQAAKARREPTVNKQHVVIDNHAYVFDPADGSFTDSGLRGGPKLKAGHDELGDYLYDPDEPEKPIVRPKGAELRQFVDYQPLPGGTKYHVPATTAAQGDASVAAGNATAQQQFGNQTFGDSKEEVDKKYQNDLTLWQDAQKDVAEHRAKRAALLGVASQVTALEQSRATLHRQIEQLEAKGDDGRSDEDDKRLAKLQDRLDKEDEKYGLLLEQNKAQLGELGAFEQSMAERNGQLVRKGADGFFSLASSRPTHPGYGRRQPPQMRGGSAPGAYAGHTFKQSDLPEIQKRLKAKTPEEARRMVEAQGGTFQ